VVVLALKQVRELQMKPPVERRGGDSRGGVGVTAAEEALQCLLLLPVSVRQGVHEECREVAVTMREGVGEEERGRSRREWCSARG
jgi:hypothetical protein